MRRRLSQAVWIAGWASYRLSISLLDGLGQTAGADTCMGWLNEVAGVSHHKTNDMVQFHWAS